MTRISWPGRLATGILLAFLLGGFEASPLRASSASSVSSVSSAGSVAPVPPVDAAPVLAALPADGFLEGWTTDGKPEVFSRDTLYQHINGEAELYLPYGFDTLVSAYFAGPGSASLEVDLFRMGSPLDAFGIYSNYRDAADETLAVGGDGIISDTQVMFHQDRFFVRLSAPSSKRPGRAVFRAVAEAVSRRLPAVASSPAELTWIEAPEIQPRTAKFTAASLLGYQFFRRGLTAEAELDGRPLKYFVVLGESEAAASDTLGLYRDSLAKDKGNPRFDGGAGKTLLARDPLYKGVVCRRVGRHLLGIIKLAEPEQGLPLLERWLSHLKAD